MHDERLDLLDEVEMPSRKGLFTRRNIIFLIVAVVMVVCVFLYAFSTKEVEISKDDTKPKHAVAEKVDYQSFLKPEPPPTTAKTEESSQAMQQTGERKLEWYDRKLISGGDAQQQEAHVDYQTEVKKEPKKVVSAITSKPTEIEAVAAGVLPNLDYLLKRGTDIDCVLVDAIDSQLPGDAKCIVAADVYSASGNVVLLDKGSTVYGSSQGGGDVETGQTRLGVAWDRADTPKGIVVSLVGRGTDNLGRTGLEGFVDDHFLDRFGAAIAISFFNTATQAVIAGLANRNSTSFSTGNGGNFSSTIMQSGVSQLGQGGNNSATRIVDSLMQREANQPSTIIINQGQSIKVRVQKDLDFSTAYKLSPIP